MLRPPRSLWHSKARIGKVTIGMRENRQKSLLLFPQSWQWFSDDRYGTSEMPLKAMQSIASEVGYDPLFLLEVSHDTSLDP